MNQLMLIGVSHSKKNDSCIDLIKEYSPIAVFTEEKIWYNKPENTRLYASLEKSVKNIIPVCSNFKLNISSQYDIARLELLYAGKISETISTSDNERYAFLIGGLHLPRDDSFESPLCFALKKMGCPVLCTNKNFFRYFKEDHEEILKSRKEIISHLIL